MRLNNRADRLALRRRRVRSGRPSLEAFEPRQLLSTGFIQGFVRNSSNQPISGATVQLLTTSNTLVAQAMTNSDGYYAFNDVAPGTYNLTDTGAISNDIQTTINPATPIDNATIQVTVLDPSLQSLGLVWTGGLLSATVDQQLNASSYNDAAPADASGSGPQGQLQLQFVSPPGALNQGNVGNQNTTPSTFYSFCSDLLHGVFAGSSFTVQPSLTPNSTTLWSDPSTSADYATNLGEIGYLYNTYGINNLSPNSTDAAALQLALWALEYNQMPTVAMAQVAMTLQNPDSPFQVNMSASDPIVEQANAYLSAAFGKSEDAYFLNLNTPAETAPGANNGQGMFSTDLLNFTNTPQSTPTINTTPGGPVVLGSGTPLSDSASLSGGSNPTGTITFYLFAPGVTPNSTYSNNVYTDTVNVSGNGTYSTAAGTSTGSAVPTIVGTYQWVAVYTSGDTNNSGATSPFGSEPEDVVDALISISPLAPVNAAGSAETFTITVTAFPAGTGTPNFATPTVTFPGGAPATVGSVTPLSGPTNNGDGTWTETWTETINSAVAGTFNVQASDTVTMGGVAVTRTTGDHYSGPDGSDSPSAVKNYVDALISITPQAPVNAVGSPEVFTVTATAFPAATGAPSFGTLGVTVSGGLTPTVSAPAISGNVATWTVTINSNSAGTFTVQASDTVTMGGVAVTRTTGDGFTSGDGSDSPSAVKNYVDANIQITPQVVTNVVNNAETFTVTVTASPAATGTLSFATPVVTVSPTPASQTVSGLTINGNVATFTITINSPTVGTFTVTASDTVTMGGIAVTRTTGDGLSGDSGPAKKFYEQITTNTGPTVLLGSGVPLTDSATLSGANNPGGSITFNLYAPSDTTYSSPVYTTTVTVSGNGTYDVNSTGSTHPGGYVPIVAGTYQWVATYNTDGTNPSVSSGRGDEPESVTPPTPSITTTPSMTTSPGGGVVAGQFATIGFWHNQNGQAVINSFNGGSTQTLLGNWLATNFPHLFGASNPYTSTSLAGLTNAQVATVYSNLWTPSGLQKNTYVQAFAVALGLYADTTSLGGQSLLNNGLAAQYGFVVTASGAGTFNVGSNGAAFGVANGTSLPVSQNLQIADSNFSPVTGLFYGGDQTKTSGANNVLNGINSVGDIPGSSSSLTSDGSSKLNDSATLSGGSNPTGTITFYLFAPGVTPNSTYSNNVYADTVAVSGDGTFTTSQGNNPGGYAPTAVGTYQWVAVYSGDANNNGVTSPFGSEPWTVGGASPTLNTIPGGSVVLGSGAKLTDSAMLAAGVNPTGTITFYLFAPGVTPNATDSNNVYSDTVTVNGNGTYTTATGTNPGGYLPSATGTYQWVAVYSGDSNNNRVTGPFGDEPEVVSPASPSLTTVPGGSVVLGSGAKLTDTATLSGAINPTGTITFYLFAPGVTPNATDSNNIYSDTVTVNGNGTYTTATGTNPGGYIPSATGTYQWVAVYSGDSNNSQIVGAFGCEPETVTSGSPVGAGDFATIGFWHNKNGQAVINSFNGSSNATGLGTWLATNFPHLFGASNPYISASLASFGKTSFDGLTNAQVATAYANLWTPSGVTKNTYVQAFAVALGLYADTGSLGYDATAAKYGFKKVSGGGGSLTFNVGSNGATFGVANNTKLSVLQILATLDNNFNPSNGTFYGGDQTKTSAANNVVNGINTTGDIALESSDSGASAVATGVVGSGFALAQGTLLVYVDNSLGNITTDEQARIDDAIANHNAELNVDGLTLVEVGADQAADANITITVADTTSIGGAAQGVLGVTEMDGTIILVSGWNWYTGADPSGIGSDQYDFETAVAHELGHGIGLGHSPDTSSVMYPLLATGQGRRDLSANDLTIIGDAENGPEPLMAAPVATGLGSSATPAAAGLMPTTATAAAPTATVAQATVVSPPILTAPVAANHTVTTPMTTVGSTFEVAVSPLASSGSAQGLGGTANSSPGGMMAQPPAGAMTTPVTTGFLAPQPAWAARQPVVASPLASRCPGVVPALDRELADDLIPAAHRMSPVSDSILDDLAVDSALWQHRGWEGAITIPVLSPDSDAGAAAPSDPIVVQPDQSRSPATFSERLAILGLAAGLWGGAGIATARKRRSGSPSLDRKPLSRKSVRD